VNNPEPWVLGINPQSHHIGLISSVFLASGLLPSCTIIFLTSSFIILSKTATISPPNSSSASSSKLSRTSFLTASIASCLSNFSITLTASFILSVANSRTFASISSSAFGSMNSIFSLPTSATISSINATIFLISSWAVSIASSINDSGTSSAPASTIITASFVPETVRCSELFSLCSAVGFITNAPSTRPTFTEPVGPLNGISDIDKATDEPIIATTSGVQSWSTDNTVATTCTSFLNPFGNNGLIGLSISLDVSVAFSDALPSLFKNPPGILPTEYNFSS